MAKRPKVLSPMLVWSLVRELGAIEPAKPVVVSGALAEQLARELGRDAAPGLVRVDGAVEGAAVLVRVLAGPATEDDGRALRAAKRAKVRVVAVQTGAEALEIPYVLATDVVHCRPGEGFPLAEILRAVAARLGEEGTALGSKLPALREPLARELIESFSRKNGFAAVAIFVPGADFPVLTLNQLRLVLRLASLYGVEVDQQRAPEVLATVAAGLGFRAVARQLLGAVPVAGWLLKGAVAYGGTRAVGEAAHRLFAAAAPR
jgi:uncharacterized protein (DUF697 family)